MIHDIIDALQAFRDQRKDENSDIFHLSSLEARRAFFLSLAKIQGVYVPRFYKAYYLEDGTVSHIEPTVQDVPRIVTKRIVPVLPPPPTKFIVPNIDIVHNRVSVEIMRGCTRLPLSCGDDHAPGPRTNGGGSPAGGEEAIKNTGFEELALLSLVI